MTPQDCQVHPYYQKLLAHLNGMVPQLMQAGRISQQEGQMMVAMMRNIGPGTVNFIQGLSARYPQGITDQAMQAEISQTFLPMIINAIRQRLGGAYGMNTGGLFTVPSTGTFGGGPFGGSYVSGGMFGGGNRTTFAGAGSISPGSTDLFGSPVKQNQTSVQPQPEPTHQTTQAIQPKTDPKWVPPTATSDDACPSSFMMCGCVDVRCNRFSTSDGQSCRRIVVCDPRIKYLDAKEAISAYQPFMNMFRDKHKFMTVMFKQLKVLNVDQSEFAKLANEIALSTSKVQTGVADKLRVILETMRHHYSMSCVEEYQRMFMDELDEHISAGELTVKNNPKMIFNKFTSFQEIIDIITKNIDKNVVNGLEAIPSFFEKFSELLEDIIYDFVTQLPKKILDPIRTSSIIGEYSRVLPVVWSDDCGKTFRGSDDLIGLLIESHILTSNGSTSDTAHKAGEALTNKLRDLSKRFTVIWAWRSASWTNYPASSSIGYDENGECVPTVFGLNSPKTDIEYFISEVSSAMESAKDTTKRRMPRSITIEFEEQTFAFNFSWMIDGNIWLGTSKYWK